MKGVKQGKKLKKTLKVSFCMPTYNKVEYLSDAVESFLEQTYENKELIIVDDASTDHTKQLTDYYTKYDNIKVFTLKDNIGVANARNLARSKATGDIIIIMDSDDMSLPSRAELVVKYFEENQKIDIVYGNCSVFDGMNHHIMNMESHDLTVWELRQANYIAHPTVAYRNTVPVKYRKDLRFIDDWYFYLDCVAQNIKFGYIPQTLAVYRPIPEGLTLKEGFTNEQKELAKEALRQEFKEFDDDITENLKNKKHQQVRIKKILKAIPDKSKVLDVGCNGGYIMDLLEKKKCDCRGIDSAPNLVKLCREKGLIVEKADARSFICPDMDVVLIGDVLEHLDIDDFKKVLENAYKSLRSGGKLVATVPYKHEFYNAERIVEHKRDYDTSDFERIFPDFKYTAKPILYGDNAMCIWMMIEGVKN